MVWFFVTWLCSAATGCEVAQRIGPVNAAQCREVRTEVMAEVADLYTQSGGVWVEALCVPVRQGRAPIRG